MDSQRWGEHVQILCFYRNLPLSRVGCWIINYLDYKLVMERVLLLLVVKVVTLSSLMVMVWHNSTLKIYFCSSTSSFF